MRPQSIVRTIAASAVATVLLALGGVASADVIYNDVDATVDATVETLALAAGGASKSVVLKMNPANGDGKSGCNLTGSTMFTASVASSDAAVATVSPTSVTFTSCGDSATLTVTPHASGTARISLAQSANTTDGTFDLAPATFDAVVTAARTATTTTVTCPSSVVYTGSPIASGCSATTTGASAFTAIPTLTYSSNTVVGTATVVASYPGDTSHEPSSASTTFAITKAGSTTTLTCTDGTYTGGALTPCQASVAGAGTVTGQASIQYTDNTDAGTASATATYPGDANHLGSMATQHFTIGQAAATCAVTPYSGTYDGDAHGVTGSCTFGGESVGTLSLGAAFTDAGTHEVSWSFEGGTNFGDQTGISTVTIAQAPTTTTVSCPTANRTYTGDPITPCSATVTGPGLDAAVDVSYDDNVDAGEAIAAAGYAGGPNWLSSEDSATFTIEKATTTVTVDCPASVRYTGDAQAPCTARATGPRLDEELTVGYSDNTEVGTATAFATYQGDANHWAQPGSTTFEVTKAPVVVAVDCGVGPYVYDGTAQEPCTARVTGAGGLDLPLTVGYADNTDAGTATASAAYPGDANHSGDEDSTTFTIDKATSTTTVTCPTSVTYTGEAHEPCSAAVDGPGGLSTSATVSYVGNTDAGTATASASYAGDGNHEPSSGSREFAVLKAGSSTSLSCPAHVTYTGLPRTPCSALVTGVGGLSTEVAPWYADNVMAGTATAHASYDGDDNHEGSEDSTTFTIDKADSVVTITCPTSVVYDGTDRTPCTARLTSVDVDRSVEVFYGDDHRDAGTVTVTAGFAGDANHNGASAETSFEITPASSTVVIVCDGPRTYTGSAVTPCSATAQGVGMSAVPLTVTYGDNVAAGEGTATASAAWSGDRNHTGATGSTTFSIAKAPSAVTVTCPAGPFYFTGSPITPACSARATGAGDLDVPVTPVTFTDNTAVGTATAGATYPGDANHLTASGSTTFAISAWTVRGYYQPVAMPTDVALVWNTVKGGSTVPLKFQIFAGPVERTSVADVASVKAFTVTCSTGPEDVMEQAATTTGGTSLRYDTTGGQFVDNWQTPKKAGTCYRVTTTTVDGTAITAYFKLK